MLPMSHDYPQIAEYCQSSASMGSLACKKVVERVRRNSAKRDWWSGGGGGACC
jgi:hypothetical protein